MVEETICLQCGNRGFENAFVYCIRCLKFAVHRYCLDEIPETFDEYVRWLCDDCKVKVRKKSAVFEHDVIPCQTRHNEVPENIKSFSRNGNEKNGVVIVENEHVSKDASEQACDARAKFDSVECGAFTSQHSSVELAGDNDENDILLPVDASKISERSLSLPQLTEEKVEGNLIGSIELSAGCLTERRLTTTSYDECVKVDIDECTRSTSDSTLPSIVKENGCSEQTDQEEKKIVNKKKRKRSRKRNITESTTEKDQHRLATASYDECVKEDIMECTRSVSDSTLPSKVKENGCSEQKDQEEMKIENKKKRKRKRNIMGSSTEKDQHKLATTSCDEHVKVDINECTRSGSDSTLPSKAKENGCSEQKNQKEKKIENKKKRNKSRKRTIIESTAEEDQQHRLATASYDECVKVDIKECTRSASDSTLPSKVKENGCTEQKDQEEKKIENKKKRKRKRNIMGSTTEKDQHGLATTSFDEHVKVDINECKRLGRHSTLPSKAKENGCSEQKDQKEKKIENKKKRRKRSRKRNIMESTTEKDQHRLAATSYNERVEVDINECSDSTLPSNVKENEGREQKDQTCISRPFESITDLGIKGTHADHPVISSNGASKILSEKKIITSFEIISQKQVHRTGVAQPLHANKRLYLENELADLSTREKDLGSSNERIENRGPEDKDEQTSTSYPKDLYYSVAQPIAMPIWRGSFSIQNSKYNSIDELIAHISNKACHKVYEAACQFQSVLHLEILPKSNIWPKSFQTSEPNGDNIALYFFPSKICNQVFEQLVEEMIHKELAFKGFVQNAELLIFTSTELPLRYWRFQNKYYLWGVFRGKKAAPSNPLSRIG